MKNQKKTNQQRENRALFNQIRRTRNKRKRRIL